MALDMMLETGKAAYELSAIIQERETEVALHNGRIETTYGRT